jgi:hypothetical protein
MPPSFSISTPMRLLCAMLILARVMSDSQVECRCATKEDLILVISQSQLATRKDICDLSEQILHLNHSTTQNNRWLQKLRDEVKQNTNFVAQLVDFLRDSYDSTKTIQEIKTHLFYSMVGYSLWVMLPVAVSKNRLFAFADRVISTGTVLHALVSGTLLFICFVAVILLDYCPESLLSVQKWYFVTTIMVSIPFSKAFRLIRACCTGEHSNVTVVGHLSGEPQAVLDSGSDEDERVKSEKVTKRRILNALCYRFGMCVGNHIRATPVTR